MNIAYCGGMQYGTVATETAY